MNKKAGVVTIHGKDYKTVALRVLEFRNDNPEHSIKTKILSNADSILIKAQIVNEKGNVIATGHAEEVRGASNINTTSALENCETSAIGRALACCGYGGEEYASADEISQSLIKQAKLEAMEFYKAHNQAVMNNLVSILAIKDDIQNPDTDHSYAAEAWKEINIEDRRLLTRLAPSKGGIFTTQERELITTNEDFRDGSNNMDSDGNYYN